MANLVSHQLLRRLCYFAAIAEAGSVRGGATQLGLSVPVMSAALAELEEEIGVTLATRSTRVFRLTSAGEAIKAQVSQMLGAAETILAHNSSSRAIKGRVGLSAPVELATHWLPDRLATFYKEFPEVLCDVNAEDAVVDLSGTDTDIAIRAIYSRAGQVLPAPNVLPLVLVAKTRPQIDRKSKGNWTLDLPFLVASRSRHTYARHKESLTEVLIQSNHQMVISGKETAIEMARRGLGAVLAIRQSVETDLASGCLEDVFPELDFGNLSLSIVLRDDRPSPAAKAFIASMADILG